MLATAQAVASGARRVLPAAPSGTRAPQVDRMQQHSAACHAALAAHAAGARRARVERARSRLISTRARDGQHAKQPSAARSARAHARRAHHVQRARDTPAEFARARRSAMCKSSRAALHARQVQQRSQARAQCSRAAERPEAARMRCVHSLRSPRDGRNICLRHARDFDSRGKRGARSSIRNCVKNTRHTSGSRATLAVCHIALAANATSAHRAPVERARGLQQLNQYPNAWTRSASAIGSSL